MIGAQEVSDSRVVDIVEQNQQIVEDLNGVGLENIDLRHFWVLRVHRVLQVFLEGSPPGVDYAVLLL